MDVLQAWLPAELSPDLDPDASLPLPIPENRAVSLAERYAVLAVVWDVHWDGDEKLDPWREWQHCRPGLMSAEEYARYKKEGMPGIPYAMLVSLVGHTTGNAPTGRLSEKDAVIVQTWLADVEADLGGGTAGSDGDFIERLLAGSDYAELLQACGLPAEPAADVRDTFNMAVRLIQRGRDDTDAAAAVALATAVVRTGGQNVRSLPFGYDGPRVEHEGWLRREDLTRWLTQLGGRVAGGRFNADSARLAVENALHEYWLRAERFDAWRPGMPSGSGWTDVIQPQAAGIARASQMAAELAAAFSQVRPVPAIEPTTTTPWKPIAQAPEPAAEADSDAADEATIATPRTRNPSGVRSGAKAG